MMESNPSDANNGLESTQSIAGECYTLRKSPSISLYQVIGNSIAVMLVAPFVVPWAILMATPLKNTLLSIVIPRIMNGVAREFQRERAVLLRRVHGRVLDVGAGGGAYMQFCAHADMIAAVEPNEQMHALLQDQARKYNQTLVLYNSLEQVTGESFDWVLLGNVLCEVDNIPETLRQIDTLLKPGGHVYFSEHIGARRGSWLRRLQNFINPAWRHCGGGCNCNRDSLECLNSVKNWEVISWEYSRFQACFGSFVLGLAVKK